MTAANLCSEAVTGVFLFLVRDDYFYSTQSHVTTLVYNNF